MLHKPSRQRGQMRGKCHVRKFHPATARPPGAVTTGHFSGRARPGAGGHAGRYRCRQRDYRGAKRGAVGLPVAQLAAGAYPHSVCGARAHRAAGHFHRQGAWRADSRNLRSALGLGVSGGPGGGFGRGHHHRVFGGGRGRGAVRRAARLESRSGGVLSAGGGVDGVLPPGGAHCHRARAVRTGVRLGGVSRAHRWRAGVAGAGPCAGAASGVLVFGGGQYRRGHHAVDGVLSTVRRGRQRAQAGAIHRCPLGHGGGRRAYPAHHGGGADGDRSGVMEWAQHRAAQHRGANCAGAYPDAGRDAGAHRIWPGHSGRSHGGCHRGGAGGGLGVWRSHRLQALAGTASGTGAVVLHRVQRGGDRRGAGGGLRARSGRPVHRGGSDERLDAAAGAGVPGGVGHQGTAPRASPARRVLLGGRRRGGADRWFRGVRGAEQPGVSPFDAKFAHNHNLLSQGSAWTRIPPSWW